MGTRSTYRVIEKGTYQGKAWKNILTLLYLQYDGYPSGHPSDTAEWLTSGTVVNGLNSSQPKVVFNGAGCLAAQLVARHKCGDNGTIEAGKAYLYPIKSRGKCGEDYCYDIIVDTDATIEPNKIEFIAYDVTGGWNNKPLRFKKLYKGTPAGFIEWVKNQKDQ
jgi:hypothetical protein